jgi:hypothetical protein
MIDDKRIRIQEAQKHTDPTDPDPQHCHLGLTLLLVADVADVLAVSRRKTVCFFLYSSIVRNFS